MGYNINEIENVLALKVSKHYKTDIQVRINIKVKNKPQIDVQNLQVKLVSCNSRHKPGGFNQIDKRWLKKYQELWGIPDNVMNLLQLYTGEKKPVNSNTEDKRRTKAHEFTTEEQKTLISFLEENKILIASDILKGRGKYAAEWILVIIKDYPEYWALKPINFALNHYIQGKVRITPKGAIKLGKITMQRKGGDAGRETANMLQFKIDPIEMMDKEMLDQLTKILTNNH